LLGKGDGNDQLNVMFSTDGQNFGNKSVATETSPEAPSLVNHNADIFIGWKGDGNDNLNVATVTELPAPAYVFQTNISNFSVSPGDTVHCSVQYINGVAGQINFANQTTGQTTTVTLVPPRVRPSMATVWNGSWNLRTAVSPFPLFRVSRPCYSLPHLAAALTARPSGIPRMAIPGPSSTVPWFRRKL
jgi:hypothetical protein